MNRIYRRFQDWEFKIQFLAGPWESWEQFGGSPKGHDLIVKADNALFRKTDRAMFFREPISLFVLP